MKDLTTHLKTYPYPWLFRSGRPSFFGRSNGRWHPPPTLSLGLRLSGLVRSFASKTPLRMTKLKGRPGSHARSPNLWVIRFAKQILGMTLKTAHKQRGGNPTERTKGGDSECARRTDAWRTVPLRGIFGECRTFHLQRPPSLLCGLPRAAFGASSSRYWVSCFWLWQAATGRGLAPFPPGADYTFRGGWKFPARCSRRAIRAGRTIRLAPPKTLFTPLAARSAQRPWSWRATASISIRAA